MPLIIFLFNNNINNNKAGGARISLRIDILAYRTCIRRTVTGFPSECCHDIGVEKLESCGYRMVKKIWRYVYSFWHSTNPRTWWTDRRTKTTWRHRLRLCIASRDKNHATTIFVNNHYKLWPKPFDIIPKPGSRHCHLAIRMLYYMSASVWL